MPVDYDEERAEALRSEQLFSRWIGRTPQPPDGYRKIVTPPRGQPARPEDAFPTSCCEGAESE